ALYHGSCHRHYHYHYYYHKESAKELANIPDTTWQSGRLRRHARDNITHNAASRKSVFRPLLGPLRGNSYRVYIDGRCPNRTLPGIIPIGSELHMTLQSMPQIKHSARFNPWSLILELLDDPRLVFNEKRRNRLLNAVSQLGWINSQNVLAQRPLFTDHLLRNRCFVLDPRYMPENSSRNPAVVNAEPETKAGKETGSFAYLSPAQSISLHQIQWPTYIADKYNALASMSTNKKQRDSADWDRIWLCTNACMEELRTAYIKNRILFNSRMSIDEQLQRLIRASFDHAPGL
ncbi:hypothetical protein J3B02_006395, partial [Coemansia erecta]